MNLGKNIKRLRLQNGVTQQALADFCHVTYQAVSKWENETCAPDVELLPKIAEFLNTSIDALFGDLTVPKVEQSRDGNDSDEDDDLCASHFPFTLGEEYALFITEMYETSKKSRCAFCGAYNGINAGKSMMWYESDAYYISFSDIRINSDKADATSTETILNNVKKLFDTILEEDTTAEFIEADCCTVKIKSKENPSHEI